MDVAAWLRGLGLERYERAFLDNEIDQGVLPSLTAEDLKDLGVTLVGHRRKLLDAVAALGTTSSATTVRATPSEAPVSADAERRHLTVMFCDLVGSTALSTRHDPEDLRELIGDYHRAVADTVGRLDGFVAKYMGDGMLIYFGYPRAHEDDSERAVRAGLAVIEAVGELPVREDLSVRLGIATGLAVVGDLIGEGAAQERGVVGETPNLAARLQTLAAPNSLVIGDATRRQIGGLFDLHDLGAQQLAGFTDPQRAWRVLGESSEVSRFEALRSGETPLVGREEEIELLVRRWRQAKGGEGRVVLISGEPGIGKSRLTVALCEHIEADPQTRLRYFCSPHHQDSALYPFIAQLERAAGFVRNDTVDAKLGKLRALVAPSAQDGDNIALLSELLSLPNSAADLNLSPQRKREKLFEALLNQLAAEARRRPVLMVFEDAHWIDPTSRELLDLTVDRVRRLPVLLAITFRPEFQPPWSGRAHITSVALNRLGERDGEALVQTLSGNTALTPEIVAEIVERTDGVPLFVEELTKAVLESAGQGDRVAAVLRTASQTALSVPATLYASLMARLDRLGPAAKETAQIGAVLGREFAYELIEPVAQRPERELQAALNQLNEAGLLFCRGAAPHASYLFKHALVQDAAYSTLLRRRRRELHGRTARTLQEKFRELTEAQPEILAHHFTLGGMPSEAVDFWIEAGERARRRSANAEAAAHLRQGLELIPGLATPDIRSTKEIAIQSTLGQIHMATKGYASADAEAAYRRASELCDNVEDADQLMRVLIGLRNLNQVQGKSVAAKGYGFRCLEIARRRGDRVYIAQASAGLGHTLCIMGAFGEARPHLANALAAYNDADYFDHQEISGYTPEIFGLGVVGWNEWFLGYPDRAHRAAAEGVAAAQRTGYPQGIESALGNAAHALLLRRCPQPALDRIETAEAIARERGFRMRGALVRVLRGWALSQQGEDRVAVVEISAGVEEYRATGARAWQPLFLAGLAKADSVLG
jgi:class 3 adenylate cyclase